MRWSAVGQNELDADSRGSIQGLQWRSRNALSVIRAGKLCLMGMRQSRELYRRFVRNFVGGASIARTKLTTGS
ncbi:hypothetical protein CKA34_30545 (plasmid) [Rhizobium sp. 11515TR]|nr:hypothetical protein CKA34_30545 [Rhizobium sp. 11515TR]